MKKHDESSKQSEVIPTPMHSLKNPYYLEYFIKTVSEIIKFYSSPHRAYTYSHKWTTDEIGDNRTILTPTNRIFWNYYNSPKISRLEFLEIVKDWDTYQEYGFCFTRNLEEVKKPNLDDPESLNNIYVEFYIKLKSLH